MKKPGKISHTYQRVLKFLITDIWHLDLSELSIMRARMIKYLKVLIITIKGYSSDRIGLQAIGLSFFSALAVVPIIALIFAVTNGFGLSDKFEMLLYTYFEGNEDIIAYLVQFANNIIDTSQNGLFGGISFLFFLWSVIWLMLNIEEAFNEIWDEAHLLVDDCSNDLNTADCLTKQLPQGWKHQFCESSTPFISSPSQQYSFCVPWKSVEFKFSLDFTSTGVVPIKSIAVAEAYDLNSFQISFPVHPQATEFNVYLSNNPQYREKEGRAGDIFPEFLQLVEWERYRLLIGDILSVPGVCEGQAAKEAGKAYLCDGTVLYLLSKEGFAVEHPDYVVTVTAVVQGEESMVRVWETA